MQIRDVENFCNGLRAELETVRGELAGIPARLETFKRAADAIGIISLRDKETKLNRRLLELSAEAQTKLREYQGNTDKHFGAQFAAAEKAVEVERHALADLEREFEERRAAQEKRILEAEANFSTARTNFNSAFGAILALQTELTKHIETATAAM